VKIAAGLLLTAGLLGAGATMLVSAADPQTPPARAADNSAPAKADAGPARENLPDGAVARMGTVRLRHDLAHPSAVAAALSADHATLVLASDGAVHVCDADGRPLRDIDLPALRLALAPDGKALACANRDTLWLVDVSTGKEIRRLVAGPPNLFITLAFSPDGKTLAAGGEGVRFWDVETGKEKPAWDGFKTGVYRLSYSRDGARLAAGGDEYSRVAEAATGKALAEFDGQAVLSPDGKAAAVGHDKHWVVLWDVDAGQSLCDFGPDSKSGRPVAFSPDGRTLVTNGGPEAKCRLWDVKSSEKRAEMPGEALALSGDGKVLALAESCAVRLCDGATGEDLHPRFGHGGPIRRAVLSPDGRTLATCGPDHVCLWDAATGGLRRRLPPAPDDASGGGLFFSSDGGRLELWDKQRICWDTATGKKLDEVSDPPDEARPLAVTPDGRLRLLPGLRVWDVDAGEEVGQPLRKGDAPEITGWQAAALSRDGALAAAVQWSENLDRPNGLAVAVWTVKEGRLLRYLQGPTSTPRARITACLRGRTLAVAAGTRIQLWDLATGRETGSVEAPSDNALVALSPDGQLLATADDSGPILWEAATCKEVRRWKGHHGKVTALLFTPDGKTLLTGSMDTTALAWDVAGRLEARDGPPSAKELDAWWDALAGKDAAGAWRGVRALAAAPGPAAPLLKDRLKQRDAPEGRLARLIADLDDDDFDVREKATAELDRLKGEAVPALRKALAARPSAEAKQRIEGLLAKSAELSADELRALRAVCALEWMGTAEAKDALQAVADGGFVAAADAAQAALGRLVKRPAAMP